jgi:hypothetical protein
VAYLMSIPGLSVTAVGYFPSSDNKK